MSDDVKTPDPADDEHLEPEAATTDPTHDDLQDPEADPTDVVGATHLSGESYRNTLRLN